MNIAQKGGDGAEAEVLPPGPKALYKFNYTYVPGVPFVDVLPPQEKPSLSWYNECIWQILRNLRNRLNWTQTQGATVAGPLAFNDEEEALVDLASLGLDEPTDLAALSLAHDTPEAAEDAAAASGGPEAFGGLSAMLEVGRIAAGAIKMGIRDPIQLLATIGQTKQGADSSRPGSAEGYLALYTLLDPPWFARPGKGQLDDDTFAWLRVAGANPLVIEKVTGALAGFPVTEAHYRAALGDAGDSLAQAGAEGRLYLADYAALAGMANGELPCPKFCAAPRALFALPRGARRLRPIAIQCGQDPEEFAIFTPADGAGWLKAKFTVQSADSNHHELVSHLGRTHLLIGPIVMSTHRQLPPAHPISRLLMPHFEGTLSINDAARTGMLGPGGPVDQALAGTIAASLAVAGATFATPYFNHGFLPAWIEARGLSDAALEYPYRDDAMLIWRAIERWVGSYVRLHYPADATVAADEMLARWAAEVAAPDGGRVSAFGEDGAGRIHTVGYLIQALTMIIFTASAQHAVVNFGQGEMTLASMTPVAAFAPPPRTRAEGAEGSWLDMVAPLDSAMFQMEFLNQLGGVHYTKLGQYKKGWFGRELAEPLAVFQKELEGIGVEIAARNEKRPGPFTFLIPERIPQSINI